MGAIVVAVLAVFGALGFQPRLLEDPARLIAENAGRGSIVSGKLTDQKDASFGFDVQRGEDGDLGKAGVIDATEVVHSALQHAAS